MARLHIILAAVITQSFYCGASVLPTRPVWQTASSAGDLIFVNQNEPIIVMPSEPAMVLAPVRHVGRDHTKRNSRAALDLKSEETLYWRGQDGTMARLKVATPGESENIFNLEHIDDMTQNISCPRNSAGQFQIQFAEAADFNDARDIWQWVNQAGENSFMMIVGAGVCGWNEGRIVYNVTSLSYDNERETAALNVRRTTWKEAAHTFDLTVGKPAALKSAVAGRRSTGDHSRRDFLGKIGGAVTDVASSAANAVSNVADATSDVLSGVADKAGEVVDTVDDAAGDAVDAVDSVVNPDVSPDFTVPFKSDFSNKSVTFSQGGVDISASCLQCSTAGAIDIQGRFRVRQFQTEEAWIEASTQGLSATAIIGLTLKGELTGTLAEKSVPVFKVSPAGVSIPGVLTIGPTVSLSLGAEISKVKGGVTVSFGGTTTIPPSTSRLDFLSETGTTSNGWKPSFKAEPFKADTFIEASAAAFVKAAVGVEISAVETGFTADLSAKLPSLSASIKAISSATCTACGDFPSGIQGSLSLGTSIDVSLKKKVLGDEEPLWGITLAQAQTQPIGGFCTGFGSRGPVCRAR